MDLSKDVSDKRLWLLMTCRKRIITVMGISCVNVNMGNIVY